MKLYRCVLIALVAFAPSCGTATSGTVTTARDPATAPQTTSSSIDLTASPYGAGVVVGQSYPYRLFTHCGILTAEFDGRQFIADVLPPDHGDPTSTVLARPVAEGTMTLVAHDKALFRFPNGATASFHAETAQDPKFGCG